MPFIVAGKRFGRLNFALRVSSTGLNEVEMAFTLHDGIVSKIKLKPKACTLDLTQCQLLRGNAGSSDDAKLSAELHLTHSAQTHGGNIKDGLQDLLTVVQPSANSGYRNQGSDALKVLARPLNALKNAGVDMHPLEVAQQAAAAAPRNSSEQANARKVAATRITVASNKTINERKIGPLGSRNTFNVNSGLRSVVKALGPSQLTNSSKPSPNQKPNLQPDRAIKSNGRRLQQTASNKRYGGTQLADGRIFAIAIRDDKSSQTSLLEQLANGLKAKPDQLSQQQKPNVIGGIQKRRFSDKAERLCPFRDFIKLDISNERLHI